jgi:hypothetical protein
MAGEYSRGVALFRQETLFEQAALFEEAALV